MQPCAVCGGQGIDADGYCVQCGTFRGVPVPPPAGPVSTPPAYPAPVSTPPAYPAPVSTPPVYPSSPGYPGPPGYYAQPALPPPRQRSPFLIPLIALSATLVVLVVAIVAVVTVRMNNRSSQGGGTTRASSDTSAYSTPQARSSTTVAAPVVDPCVVGSWRVSSHEERVAIDNVGNVTFTGGHGARLRLGADGSGVTDYGRGTEYEGTAQGRTITLIISGTVSYRYRTANGTVSFTGLRSDAEGLVKLDGVEVGREDFEPSADPASYTCSGDRLTETTNLYEIVLARES